MMRLYELAHRLTTDITLTIPQEYRPAFLSYLVSGFDEAGKRIAHSPGQTNTLVCMDCRRSSDECASCNEIQQTEKESR
jgi:hypothetical protein